MTNPSSSPKNGRVFRIEMPCDLTYVKSIRRFLVSVLRLGGVPEEDRDLLGLAFTEMCNNSIEHGCALELREDTGIQVKLDLKTDRVELSVRDPGRGDSSFTDLERALGNAEAPPEAGNERGMGLFLVRSVMDEVVVTDEGDGTVLKAVKRWSESS